MPSSPQMPISGCPIDREIGANSASWYRHLDERGRSWGRDQLQMPISRRCADPGHAPARLQMPSSPQMPIPGCPIDRKIGTNSASWYRHLGSKARTGAGSAKVRTGAKRERAGAGSMRGRAGEKGTGERTSPGPSPTLRSRPRRGQRDPGPLPPCRRWPG